jgi:hypothetical protein
MRTLRMADETPHTWRESQKCTIDAIHVGSNKWRKAEGGVLERAMRSYLYKPNMHIW